MRIAVIGSGAIGCLIAGYLKAKGQAVSLICRADSRSEIQANGLEISGVRGSFKIKIDAPERLAFKPDLVILAVKTQDLEAAIEDNLKFIAHTLILTTQNGVQADNLAARYFPGENIVSSIVMFGATYLRPGKVVHNFEGSWVIGRDDLKQVLGNAFAVVVSRDIPGMKYLKVFTNANNCLAAILGLSMQEAFSDINVSRISIAIWKEAFEVISQAGIKLVSLPGFPLENLTKLINLPGSAGAGIFSGIMQGLSKEPLYGSILQSIMRGRSSEIDYINGEFVRIAQANNSAAPLNKLLVDLVHQVEKGHKFLTREELLAQTTGLVD